MLLLKKRLLQYSTVILSLLLLNGCGDQIVDSGQARYAPKGLITTSGTRTVTLDWSGVSGASGYTVYWSHSDDVSKTNGAAITTEEPHYDHRGLANNTTYYYVVTAHTNTGESNASNRVSGTPKPAAPAQPDEFSLKAGDARTTLTWQEGTIGASRYTLYWDTQATITADTARNRIEAVNAPFVHSGLTNGEIYYYIVVAENQYGQSTATQVLRAQPQKPVPTASVLTSAVVSSGKVELQWQNHSNAESFELYWNTQGNVSTSDNKITQVTSPYYHSLLSDGTTYYYRVLARNSGGDSALSNELLATPPDANSAVIQTPAVTPPGVPQFSANENSFQDSRNTLSWNPVPGATRYNLYWKSVNAGVGKADNKISNIQSKYTHIGLTNGNAYFYRVSAINDGGESDLSPEIVLIPQVITPGQPAGVTTLAGNGWIAVRWTDVEKASGYSIQLDGIDTATNVSSPYVLQGLANGTTYSIAVTALNAGVAGKPSDHVSAVPQLPPPNAPDNVTAQPQNGQVIVQWDAALLQDPNDTVSGYQVYFRTRSGVTPGNGTRIDATPSQNTNNRREVTHTALENGQRYYYVVTATNGSGREGRISQEVWARPQVPIPDAPNSVWTATGDNQVVIHYSPAENVLSHNLYWTKALADGARSAPQVIANFLPGGVFTDGTTANGSTYYFQISAFNNAGESARTPEVDATLRLPVPQNPPQNIATQAGNTQVTINWAQQPEATLGYALYWSTEPEIDPSTTVPIEVDTTTVTYDHSDLQNGQTYFYQIAAVNAGGESALSEVVVARPQIPSPGAPVQAPTASAGDAVITIEWPEVSSATSYTLYRSTDVEAPKAQWARFDGVLPGISQTGLSHNQLYYYYITASNPGGESGASPVVSATPLAPLPESPTGTIVTAGNAQVSIDWDTQTGLTYNLYWTTDPTVDPVNGPNQLIDVRPAYVHTELLRNTTYRYQLTANNATGEGPASAIMSGTPTGGIPTGADPGQSTASIAPTATSVSAGTDIIITVNAADSSGNAITTGGELVALTILGANANLTTEGPLAATDNNDGTYTVSYNAQLAGIDDYQLTIDEAGTPVAIGGSYSKTITAAAASAGTSAAAIPAGPYSAGVAVSLRAQVHDVFGNPTTGSVEFAISGTNAQTLSGVGQGGGVYNASYTPTTVGSDNITVTVNGNTLAGSPFTRSITASTASASNSSATIPAGAYTAGQAVTLSAQINDASGNPTSGFVTFVITDSTEQTLTLTGVAQGGGRYTVGYTPIIIGSANIVTRVDDTAIPGATVTRNINAGVANTAASSINITPTNPVTAGTTVNLDLLVKDANNNPTTASVTMAVAGANAQALTPNNPIPGTYTASYPANLAGTDSYAITINDVTLAVPTRTINAAAADIAASSVSVTPADPVIAGTTVNLEVTVKDTNNNPTAATVTIAVTGANAQTLVMANPQVGTYRGSYFANNSGVDNYTTLINTLPLVTPSRTIDSANVAPTDITLTASSVAENSPNATLVGILGAVDSNGDTHSYRFVAPNNDAGGRFRIVGNQLQVANPGLLDYEVARSHSISVQVQDQGNLVFSRDLTINLSDVNDVVPVITNSNVNPSVPESSSAVATLSVSDIDTVNAAFTYTLSGADAPHFEVLSNNLQFKATSIPDFEVPADAGGNNVYDVNVVVNDGINDSTAKTFTVTVTNVPEMVTGINVVNGNTQVSLSWTPQPSEQYEIHSGAVTGFTPDANTLIQTTASGVGSYTDINLINFTTYYYRLIAVQDAVRSAPSATVEGLPSAPISVPVGLSAVSGDGQVTLAWTPDASVSYEVHRGGASDFLADATTHISTTQQGAGGYVDTTVANSTLYYYRIIAVNGAAKSAPTASVLGAPVAVTAPTPPTLSLTGQNNAIQLTLTPTATTDSYKVYFNTTGNVTKADAVAYSGASISTIHSGLTNNQLYYYRTSAITGGLEGLLSAEQVSFPFSVKSSWVKAYPTHPVGAIRDVAYTGQQYIAIGTNNYTITSPDREAWTARSTGTSTTQFNRSLAHDGNGTVFMATKSGLYRSIDHGITWELVTIANAPNGVTPSSNVYGVFHNTSTSPASPTTPVPTFVVFIRDYKFTTINGDTNNVIWSSQKMSDGFLYDIIFDGNNYYAQDGNFILSSNDGVIWSKALSPLLDNNQTATETFNYLTYAKGNFYVGTYYNTDTTNEHYNYICPTFTTCLSYKPTGHAYQSVAYSPTLNKYYRINGGWVWNSTLGQISWTANLLAMGDPRPQSGVKWIERGVNSHLMAYGAAGTLASSTDGVKWTRNTPDGYINDVIWDGSQFVGVSAYFTATSSNGVNWTLTNQDYNLRHVEYDGLGYIAVGGTANSKAAIFSSIDTTTWTPVYIDTNTASSYLWSSASNGTDRVAVGGGGMILTDAPDGVWKTANVTPATTARFQSVAWNGVAFLAVAYPNVSVVYRSVDGINWTSIDTGVILRPGIVVKDGLFYVFGVNTLLTSPDGQVWTTTPTNVSTNLNWDGTLFWSGTSHVSPDAIHWNLVSSPSYGTVLKSPTATISFSAQGIFR